MGRVEPNAPVLHIVVTCTKRKRHRAEPHLQLGTHGSESLPRRLETWLRALSEAPGVLPVPVGDLYAGDHWRRSASLPAVAAEHGIDAQLWVCSAGYGLLPAGALVRPYSATFSRGHPDAVWRAGDGLHFGDAVADWWRGLAEWEGPNPGAARSLGDLATAYPSSGIWVVASQTYLNAMDSDLRAAARSLDTPDRLVIISAGARQISGFGAHTLEFDWRLQGDGGLLGGAAMSLNVRVAELLLRENGEHTVASLNRRLRAAASALPARRPKVGVKVSDAQVEQFLRDELHSRPEARRTPLLRKLRDELRWAFEEKRFARLYDRIRTSLLTSEADQ